MTGLIRLPEGGCVMPVFSGRSLQRSDQLRQVARSVEYLWRDQNFCGKCARQSLEGREIM
jgi:hypothetical protein